MVNTRVRLVPVAGSSLHNELVGLAKLEHILSNTFQLNDCDERQNSVNDDSDLDLSLIPDFYIRQRSGKDSTHWSTSIRGIYFSMLMTITS